MVIKDYIPSVPNDLFSSDFTVRTDTASVNSSDTSSGIDCAPATAYNLAGKDSDNDDDYEEDEKSEHESDRSNNS